MGVENIYKRYKTEIKNLDNLFFRSVITQKTVEKSRDELLRKTGVHFISAMDDRETQGRTCGTCAYHIRPQCRRNPPLVIAHQESKKTEWPTVNAYHGWCGEWREMRG